VAGLIGGGLSIQKSQPFGQAVSYEKLLAGQKHLLLQQLNGFLKKSMTNKSVN